MNQDVDVDYNDPDSLAANRDSQLVITLNSQSNDQNYKYPDEDENYFKNFPSDRLVFFKILAEENLPCTKTLEWLLQNVKFYDKIEELNTTSVYQCLLTNYCPELKFCKCRTETSATCEGFDEFSDLDFDDLEDDSKLRSDAFQINLTPVDRKVLDATLKMGPIRMRSDGQIILRNVDGFDYDANPFNGISSDKNLNLIIYNSVMRTNRAECSPGFFAEDNIGMFTEFDTILLLDDVTYTDRYELL